MKSCTRMKEGRKERIWDKKWTKLTWIHEYIQPIRMFQTCLAHSECNTNKFALIYMAHHPELCYGFRVVKVVQYPCPLFSSRWNKRPGILRTYLHKTDERQLNSLNPELNPICYLLPLLGAHHFLHISRIRVKLLTFRLLMSYIYGAPILDVSRSHATTQHSR